MKPIVKRDGVWHSGILSSTRVSDLMAHRIHGMSGMDGMDDYDIGVSVPQTLTAYISQAPECHVGKVQEHVAVFTNGDDYDQIMRDLLLDAADRHRNPALMVRKETIGERQVYQVVMSQMHMINRDRNVGMPAFVHAAGSGTVLDKDEAKNVAQMLRAMDVVLHGARIWRTCDDRFMSNIRLAVEVRHESMDFDCLKTESLQDIAAMRGMVVSRERPIGLLMHCVAGNESALTTLYELIGYEYQHDRWLAAALLDLNGVDYDNDIARNIVKQVI